MTTSEYIMMLRFCKLSKSGKDTVKFFGKSPRMLRYYASGKWPIPVTMAKDLRWELWRQTNGVAELASVQAEYSTGKKQRA